MEGKSSTQMVRSFFSRCLPISFTLNDVGQFRPRLGKFFENPKMFTWTRRRQLCQICPKFFTQSPKIIIKFSIFQNNFFLEKIDLDVECSFDNPPENFLVSLCKKVAFFQKKIFFSQSIKMAILMLNVHQMILFLEIVFSTSNVNFSKN